MSWAEIKKSVNSNLEVPLDELITEVINQLSTAVSKIDKYPNVTQGNVPYGYDKLTVRGKGMISVWSNSSDSVQPVIDGANYGGYAVPVYQDSGPVTFRFEKSLEISAGSSWCRYFLQLAN
ncbi:hypothetical protein [Anaerolentibacter hominis]|uniref:hypothetical protein n=1 Tax=Anaerolentibacter hominis TaxID=3079009 RepID=UPI0031B839D4